MDLLFYGGAAIVLLGVGIYKGVVVAFAKGGILFAGVVVGILLILLAFTFRDARRKRWSPASVGVGVTWVGLIVALTVWDIVEGMLG